MRYFANPCTQKVRDAMTAGLLDCIVTPLQGNRIPQNARVCADNGAFGKGYPGDDAWWAWLRSLPVRPGDVAFAVAPDVPFNAAATLRKSLPWLRQIRLLGIPSALAAQDGLENLDVPWHEFDVLFIGGTTTWKLGPHAASLVAAAKRRGKQAHMGRVNSAKRFRYAQQIGCDSADGTYITFGPDRNLPAVLAWLRSNDQTALWDAS